MKEIDKIVDAVTNRLINGIPPCEKCGNTSPDGWSIDVFSQPEATEVCDVCGTRRVIPLEED